jgi:hypothetical protein
MAGITTRLLLPLALAGLLAACAPAALHRDHAGAADLAGDTDACAALARAGYPAGDPSMSNAVSLEMEQAMRRQSFVGNCLRDKGWR